MNGDRFKVGEIRWGWWDAQAEKLAFQCWVFEHQHHAVEHNPKECDFVVVAAVYDGEKWVRLEDAPRSLKKIAKAAA